MTLRPFHFLLALAVFLVWSYMLVHSTRLETQEATRSEIVLDDDGRPTEIVWQEGRGYRLPTVEEADHARR